MKLRMVSLAAIVGMVSMALAPLSAAGAPAETSPPTTRPFLHPGLFHSAADFARMRDKVAAGEEPWKSGWEKLLANPHSSLNWHARPVETVWRGHGSPENYALLYNDIAAAYDCGLRWRITRDTAYADKAVEILNQWSATLQQVNGSADRFLAAGIYGYEMAIAGEDLRGYPGWKPADFQKFQDMMLRVFYPVNHDFLLRHNGAKVDHYWCNWDACNMDSILAIGVLCDRRDLYDEAVDYFKHGAGNGSIEHAVVHIFPGGLGQSQESGRDQGHATLNVSLLGAFCQMAWNQGDDLFAYDHNRFLAMSEYIAKYNLGYDLPYISYANSSFSCPVISPGGRGDTRPSWELVYNHYAVLRGIKAPYSAMFAAKIRPEGGGGDYGPNSGGYDQLGFGTLAFTLDPQASHH